ncbi:MAG: hypothetical protein VX293_01855 [Candidatus Latescibacterota bacterium]|nr:hypothetical protein [Candidatus Latescibacterota bacterium]
MPRALFLLWIGLVATGCSSGLSEGPYAGVEREVWRTVNSSHRGRGGVLVQATLRTFAYEIAHAYARAEHEDLGQEQLEYRIKRVIYSYVDGTYPAADGTDINSLYLQYLIYVNPSFNARNPIQKQAFDTWRGEYVRRVVDVIYDRKFQILRNIYDDRWGLTLYSRLVFTIFLSNEESLLKPEIADIGSRTFLVNQRGERFEPSGTFNAYPYESDRPEGEVLDGKTYYRVFFPNRKADKKTPIIEPDDEYLELHIEGLGSEPQRTLRWELPFEYPEMPERKLPSDKEVFARRAAERAERRAKAAAAKAAAKAKGE